MSAVLRTEACRNVFLKARESLDRKMDSAVRSMIGYSKHSESDSLGELGFGSCLLLALISALSNSELMLSAALLELSASYSPLKSLHFAAWLVEDYTIDTRIIRKALEQLFRIDRSGLFSVPIHIRKLLLELARRSGIRTESFLNEDVVAGTEENAEASSITTEENVQSNSIIAEENAQDAESPKESDIKTTVTNAVATDRSTYDKYSSKDPLLHSILKYYRNTAQSLTLEQRKETFSKIKSMVRLITDHKGDINTTNAAGETALHIAAGIADVELIRSLLAAGAVADVHNNAGDTPLHIATSCNNYTILEVIASCSSPNISIKNASGKSPLHLAVSYGFIDCVKLLLEPSKNVDTEDMSGYTPLCTAAEIGDMNIVEMLFKKNVGINHTIKDSKKMPLHLAAENGHTDIVKLLLDKGADVQAKASGCNRYISTSELTPLHFSAMGGHLSTVQELLAKGAILEAKDSDEWTPLHWAAEGGHLTTVRELCTRGANFTAKTSVGGTPLHLAAMGGHHSTVRELLERGANLEAKDSLGRTPLHIAAWGGHLPTVKVLHGRKANLEAMDVHGRTPFDLAILFSEHDVASFLTPKRPTRRYRKTIY